MGRLGSLERGGRDTLAFDEVLYRDRFLRVTPAELVLDEHYVPLVGPRVIAVEDVFAVRICAAPPPVRRWWARLYRSLFVPRAAREAGDSALVVAIKDREFRVSVAGPVEDALRAVEKARAIAT